MGGPELVTVSCNRCGTALDVPPGVRFITCTQCGARLEVRQTGNVAYTQVLDANESTDARVRQIAADVGAVRAQNEVERLDREWMMERERYMITGKWGRRYEPSRFGGIILIIVFGGFGVLWAVMASSMGAPGVFPLFGLLFVVVAIAGGIWQFTKAGEYERAERAYQERRRQLLEPGNRFPR